MTDNLIVAISNIILAIATFTASYIAIRSNKIKYKIQGGTSFIVGNGTHSELLYAIHLTNKNTGIPFKIQIGMVINAISNEGEKLNFIINPAFDKHPSAQLPCEIKYGDTYTFLIGKEGAKNIIKNTRNKKYKFFLYDSVGNKFKHIILKKDLIKVINYEGS